MCGVQETMSGGLGQSGKLWLIAKTFFTPLGIATIDTPQASTQPLFRSAIIYNDRTLNGVGRDLHVLMDPSEFSEGNLRTLFPLFNQRSRDLPGFTAYIETSLQDIQTPEEREGPGISEVPGNPKGGKTPAVTIRHSAQADSLYIYLPTRATDHPKKIDLRLAAH